ncbi:hypothetical protein IWW50_002914 [Coemansia erecta]|nr:hypothetical protein IWW50_002914 [Coemansia erecta]
MAVTKHAFSPDGKIDEYVLRNSAGTKVYVTTWGARLTRFVVRDKTGTFRDIVAGFESYEKWVASLDIDDPYFGATVGRVAGRIHPCDRVEIGGQYYALSENQPNKVCLHGGNTGFDKRVFTARVVQAPTAASVEFTYVSEDGEEGFPGTMELRVTYSLDNEDDALHIEYHGQLLTGTESIANPTNHTYWNLTGFDEPTIHNHVCWLAADHYMRTRDDPAMTPDGRLLPTKNNTKLDFSTPHTFGRDLDSFDKDTYRGFDHVFVNADGGLLAGGAVRKVAVVLSPQSGLRLTVLSDQPALVVYTGNWISDGLVGKYGVQYGNHAAVALETQGLANAPNIPQFRDQVTLTKDKPLYHHTVYRVDVVKP